MPTQGSNNKDLKAQLEQRLKEGPKAPSKPKLTAEEQATKQLNAKQLNEKNSLENTQSLKYKDLETKHKKEQEKLRKQQLTLRKAIDKQNIKSLEKADQVLMKVRTSRELIQQNFSKIETSLKNPKLSLQEKGKLEKEQKKLERKLDAAVKLVEKKSKELEKAQATFKAKQAKAELQFSKAQQRLEAKQQREQVRLQEKHRKEQIRLQEKQEKEQSKFAKQNPKNHFATKSKEEFTTQRGNIEKIKGLSDLGKVKSLDNKTIQELAWKLAKASAAEHGIQNDISKSRDPKLRGLKKHISHTIREMHAEDDRLTKSEKEKLTKTRSGARPLPENPLKGTGDKEKLETIVSNIKSANQVSTLSRNITEGKGKRTTGPGR